MGKPKAVKINVDEIKAVGNSEEIKDNINTFNRGKETNGDVLQSRFEFWVCYTDDTGKLQFAPSKFVQCIEMDFGKYRELRKRKACRKACRGDFVDGRRAWKRIEKVTGKIFTENADLENKLEKQVGIGAKKDRCQFLKLF